MDSNELSQAIRKIIGYPEKTNQSQEARQGKRVFGGVGEYWYNGERSGKNGDKKKGDDDKKGGKKKGGKKGGGGDDDKAPIGDPLRRPQVGEPMPRLEGLHDCDTGQCVAVNFDPNMVKTPDGWQDPCTPPAAEKGDRLIKINMVTQNCAKTIDNQVKYLKSSGDINTDLSKIRNIAHNYLSSAPYDTSTTCHDEMESRDPSYYRPYQIAANIYKSGDGFYRSVLTRSGGYTRGGGFVNYAIVTAQGGEPVDDGGKPSECAEMVSTAGGFKPACENTSGYPPALQGSTTGFTLCDANGNPVSIETNGRGWKITTKDYTAIVDEEFTVQSVTDN